MRSLFITFEGLDGSGKSTHLRRAARWMEEHSLGFELTHEPGGTPLGDAIRGLFLDPRWGAVDGRVEALLVFASRRQHLLELIEPALAAGKHVLCDRFTDSTLAYQGAARGQARSWVEELARLAIDARQPDHTLLFDLSPEAAQRRCQSESRKQRGDIDRLDVEDLGFYSRVREGYLELARREPRRVRRIDSEGDVEQTWAQVETALADLFAPALRRGEGR